MNFDIVAILVASIAQFIIGAIWYMPLFGGLWGRIHGFDIKSPEAQKEMQKGMMPLLAVQFIITVVMTFVLAIVLGAMPASWNAYGMALHLWLGFIVPTQIGAVIFGGTEPKWVVKKIAVMAGAALVNILAATYILTSLFG
jgi:hypothetical protein